MNSFDHLFEKLIDYNNVKRALKNAAKRKHRRGDVCYIFENEDEHVKAVIRILTNGEFKPQTHNLMKIQDGVTKKERFIMQPYFFRNQYGQAVYEQVIHHAVVQVLRPIFERSMYFHSNGSIPDRGCHSGKKYLQRYIHRNKNTKKLKYFLKADIHHYYQSINIDILKKKLASIIKDKKFLQVVFTILDSNIAHTKNGKVNMGLPIGFYTSQWFANFYLEKFDYFIKQKLKANFYSRYMDDFIIIGSNKQELHRKLIRIQKYLKEIDLNLKPSSKIALFDYTDKNGKTHGECINFMGFKFYRNRTTLRKHVLMSTRKAAHLVDKSIKNNCMNWYVACRMVSYYGWFAVTDTYKYYHKYIHPYAHINVCKKVIHQHDHKKEVLPYIKRTELINKALNIGHKRGLEKYKNKKEEIRRRNYLWKSSGNNQSR